MKNKNIILFLTSLWIPMTVNCTFTTHSIPPYESICAVILAAGQGSRLHTGITKLITPICGQPMIVYPVKLLDKLSINCTVIVGYQKELVIKALQGADIAGIQFAEQTQQLGTGHALLCSKDTWNAEHILVMNGDMPLVTEDIIKTLCTEHIKTKAAMSIITCYNVDPTNAFGRIVSTKDSIKIIEKKHFEGKISDHPYVNAGIYMINRTFLETYLNEIAQNEVTQEFYITDLVEIANKNNLPVTMATFPFDQCHGVNTFAELAVVERIKQNELINYWMTQGVRFIAPHTIQVDVNALIGKGCVINPGAQILNNTHIGEFTTIAAHTVLDNAQIGNKVAVGPHSFIQNFTILSGSTVPAYSVNNV